MANDEIKVFQTSTEKMFTAMQKTIRDLGYKVDLMDKENGLINFKTGMSLKSFAGQEMSAMIIDNNDESVEVSITGRRNQFGIIPQIYDWGEKKGIVKKVFTKLEQYL